MVTTITPTSPASACSPTSTNRISDGAEQDPLGPTYCDVYAVLEQHGLLSRCLNSP
jgi:hypothetical protein